MAKSEKKLVKSKSGLRMVSVDERIASPFTTEEPQWIPDNTCTHCQNLECQTKFDFMKRKHHCRRCGKCFCDSCCKGTINLYRMNFIDPVRHCKDCLGITKKENEFFEKHIKTLIAGGQFKLHSDNENANILPGSTFTCLLSSDHRYLRFEGDIQGQESIPINKIESVQIAASEVDQQGNRLGTGIAIRYTNTVGNNVMLKMDVEDGQSRRQSMSWVAAMQKAFKLVYDSRNPNPSP